MYCPSCSAPTAEGAKFCKSCGLSLNILTQALSGGGQTSDLIKEREYRRARKQISDGIQGSAIGTALIVGAVVAYLIMPKDGLYYAVSLVLALAGVVKLFKSAGHIVDAKMGSKLIRAGEQTQRSSGGLTGSQPLQAAPVTTRVSQRFPEAASGMGRESASPPDSIPGKTPGTTRVGTSRVASEQSSPLGKISKEDDLMSKLRN